MTINIRKSDPRNECTWACVTKDEDGYEFYPFETREQAEAEARTTLNACDPSEDVSCFVVNIKMQGATFEAVASDEE